MRTEYRLSELKIEKKTEYGDWEVFSQWKGKFLLGGNRLEDILKEINKFFKEVLLEKGKP